jgi:hypothetical protein
MHSCEASSSALKTKLTHIESKKEKPSASLQGGYESDIKRNAGKMKKSIWFLYAEEAPLCRVFLNLQPQASGYHPWLKGLN